MSPPVTHKKTTQEQGSQAPRVRIKVRHSSTEHARWVLSKRSSVEKKSFEENHGTVTRISPVLEEGELPSGHVLVSLIILLCYWDFHRFFAWHLIVQLKLHWFTVWSITSAWEKWDANPIISWTGGRDMEEEEERSVNWNGHGWDEAQAPWSLPGSRKLWVPSPWFYITHPRAISWENGINYLVHHPWPQYNIYFFSSFVF
jgi:hypothetical protein